jgi:hypothetical protein
MGRHAIVAVLVVVVPLVARVSPANVATTVTGATDHHWGVQAIEGLSQSQCRHRSSVLLTTLHGTRLVDDDPESQRHIVFRFDLEVRSARTDTSLDLDEGLHEASFTQILAALHTVLDTGVLRCQEPTAELSPQSRRDDLGFFSHGLRPLPVTLRLDDDVSLSVVGTPDLLALLAVVLVAALVRSLLQRIGAVEDVIVRSLQPVDQSLGELTLVVVSTSGLVAVGVNVVGLLAFRVGLLVAAFRVAAFGVRISVIGVSAFRVTIVGVTIVGAFFRVRVSRAFAVLVAVFGTFVGTVSVGTFVGTFVIGVVIGLGTFAVGVALVVLVGILVGILVSVTFVLLGLGQTGEVFV